MQSDGFSVDYCEFTIKKRFLSASTDLRHFRGLRKDTVAGSQARRLVAIYFAGKFDPIILVSTTALRYASPCVNRPSEIIEALEWMRPLDDTIPEIFLCHPANCTIDCSLDISQTLMRAFGEPSRWLLAFSGKNPQASKNSITPSS